MFIIIINFQDNARIVSGVEGVWKLDPATHPRRRFNRSMITGTTLTSMTLTNTTLMIHTLTIMDTLTNTSITLGTSQREIPSPKSLNIEIMKSACLQLG